MRAAIDQLSAAGEAAELDVWVVADARFHEAIRDAARNPKLTQIAAMVYPLIERVRHMHLREEPAPARIAAQTAAHRDIGEAILARDGERAETLTRCLFADARERNALLLRRWVEPLRRQF
ncbi:MAG: FCD domain-containing protein [Thermomicrobiales bacterium]